MADKAQRMIFMLKKFQNGRKFNTKELQQLVSDELDYVSLRTVQRDLQELQDSEPTLTSEKEGGEIVWRMPRLSRINQNTVRIESNELLSFHILKAHLKTFSGTMIEDDVKELSKKLDEIAPGSVYSEETLYWDQNIGSFDYTQYDPTLRRVIKYITEEKWVKIRYERPSARKAISYTCLLRKIFTYAGMLYVLAYVPSHDSHIALSLQNIDNVDEIDNFKHKIPEFNFNEWTKTRFGVYWGEPVKVKLQINKEYNRYFSNRRWHHTQKENLDKNGNLILEMKVPIAPDFISWIMSWCQAIKILEPISLKKEIIKNLREGIDNIEE
jgi:predicted DNA-binding transcriptional regulator YafY